MKMLLMLLLIPFLSWAQKNLKDFNQALNNSVKDSVKKDDQAFKRKAGRAPASIDTDEASDVQRFESQKKSLDKIEKNVKQVGSKEW